MLLSYKLIWQTTNIIESKGEISIEDLPGAESLQTLD